MQIFYEGYIEDNYLLFSATKIILIIWKYSRYNKLNIFLVLHSENIIETEFN